MRTQIRFLSTLVAIIVLPAATTLAQQSDEEDFVPRSSAPPAVRTGGASRGASSAANAARVTIFAPADTVGLTTREQPVIYWNLSADTDKPIEIAINDPKNLEKPLLDTTLKGPTKAGLHKLDLGALKQDGKPIKLAPDVKYDIVIEVSAASAGASSNPTATCKIMRDSKGMPADAAAEKDKVKLASIYGKQGVWFDYIDALNAAIEAKPKDEKLVERRTKALASQRIAWSPDGKVTESRKGSPK